MNDPGFGSWRLARLAAPKHMTSFGLGLLGVQLISEYMLSLSTARIRWTSNPGWHALAGSSEKVDTLTERTARIRYHLHNPRPLAAVVC